jgi:hypothetical protein
MVAAFVALPLFAMGPMVGTSEKDTAGIDWLYDSPLTVFEEITPLEGGLYRYSYSFLNTDINNIWHFNVFTRFEVQLPATPFTEFQMWNAWYAEIDWANQVYDARNLDPEIISSGQTWYGNGPDYPYPDHPIPNGTFVEGFSFIGTEMDPSPKVYFYETLESGHALDTGFVAAVGMTENGVVATTPTSWGQVKCLFR